MPKRPTPYVGRFAPSPTGSLHFGSLVCALASFLDARAQGGQWLVRMEDIDPPREETRAQEAILRTLEAHELHWDGDVLRQSSRQQAYTALLAKLQNAALCYPCDCSRRRLQSLHGCYDGHCRRHPPAPDQPAALRLKVDQLSSSHIAWEDGIHGAQAEDLQQSGGDFIIHRKDGLFAYQLAVVADDIAQGITHVVRGSDLLDTTARQIYLFHLLGHNAPHYSHIPVIVDQHRQKLSKQTHAPAVNDATATENLWLASRSLGLQPPANLRGTTPQTLLQWAASQWRLPPPGDVPAPCIRSETP